ncbi:hypothetical protein CERSUDRAFT_96022 [Gelatoporia subvermispora B]|uniref:Uncharacterized protein n=1 Tax=Ceriporiopsis subvermispora (strain B) TaxID=914234 RepID=M2QFH1_CERS8|nr:hypothetical protein CERSUDRAFT_96022 [Gelatoporia subvermispora B]
MSAPARPLGRHRKTNTFEGATRFASTTTPTPILSIHLRAHSRAARSSITSLHRPLPMPAPAPSGLRLSSQPVHA